jgi:hypothetical protein
VPLIQRKRKENIENSSDARAATFGATERKATTGVGEELPVHIGVLRFCIISWWWESFAGRE